MPTDAPRFLGPTARLIRERTGIRQAELARRVGISRSHLANIEKGERSPSLTVALAIAEQLDVEPLVIMLYTSQAAA